MGLPSLPQPSPLSQLFPEELLFQRWVERNRQFDDAQLESDSYEEPLLDMNR